jgi:hypothetical protein
MLSFFEEDKGIPVALVGKRILYMHAADVPDGFKEIDLPEGHTFQQIPGNAERDVLYISAMSGSGKTYYTSEFVKQYKKKNPKNDVFLFSSIDEDKCLDSLKYIKRFNIKSKEFLECEIDAKDFEKSCCIFDDVDTIVDKAIKKKVFSILDSILQTGRHFRTTCIFTSHNACSGIQTKTILNEATSITVFPRTSGNKSLNYLCDAYLGLDKKQVQALKNVKGRYVTFIRSYPRCMLTENTCAML